MAEIINLRMARKVRERAANRAEADANRARHGRSKGERERLEAERARSERTLDGARLEKD
ncbi:DUF4169 family protein [Novosphingobium panipatense]|jgi:hypothetical protein|uniref:DUF4169 family protein n=1 Tax=Novosphingobium TaxID=165696 RepID=UPI000CDB4037|nr:DUF4169 family protein [Novosphingobium sp. HII-3]